MAVECEALGVLGKTLSRKQSFTYTLVWILFHKTVSYHSFHYFVAMHWPIVNSEILILGSFRRFFLRIFKQ